jgi:hypothetical protein
MRHWLLLIMVTLLVGCQVIKPPALQPSTPSPPGSSGAALTTSPSHSYTPELVSSPTQNASATPLEPRPPETIEAPRPTPVYSVSLHPDGGLYVGDQISLEIVPPTGLALEKEQKAQVQVETLLGDNPETKSLGEAVFKPFGIANRLQATLLWAWDTHDLEAGTYALTFSILPQGPTWAQEVILKPTVFRPPLETHAYWGNARSECCLVYYITATAAERDLSRLLDEIDQQAESASKDIKTNFSKPVTVVLLSRLLGHGGFAEDGIAVSYLDRDYAANDWGMVVHHEMIHILDLQLGGHFRPTILVEGLAVYLSGGHFKPEPLLPRAATLPEIGRYLPLQPLANDFYNAQHESGYLEAGALVEYMVQTWGWETFSAFYRDIQPPDGKEQSEVINIALQKHLGITFADLERRFLEALKRLKANPRWESDVRLSIAFYDTVRHYEKLLDPSAYFKTAWLPDITQARQRGVVTDYLRHPNMPENQALETMLVAAGDFLRKGDYTQVESLLAGVNAVLDAIEVQHPHPFSTVVCTRADCPGLNLAADYYGIVTSLQVAGYETQRISLNNGTAQVWVTKPGPAIKKLNLRQMGDRWVIMDTQE